MSKHDSKRSVLACHVSLEPADQFLRYCDSRHATVKAVLTDYTRYLCDQS